MPSLRCSCLRHKQCMNLCLRVTFISIRVKIQLEISVHYRARRWEWRKTILSRIYICAVTLFKHKQLGLWARTLIILDFGTWCPWKLCFHDKSFRLDDSQCWCLFCSLWKEVSHGFWSKTPYLCWSGCSQENHCCCCLHDGSCHFGSSL